MALTHVVLYLISVGFSVLAEKDCHYVSRDNNDTIKTPSYPQKYRNDLNCSWKIIVENGRQILLSTIFFHLENSYNCESDALYIYDGPDENSRLYAKPYCGRNGPVNVTSTDNALFLRFITDKLDNARGFDLAYKSFKVCDYEFNNQEYGSFTSPRFPKNYYENANCSYRIKTTNNKAIVIKFQHFQLENAINGKCLDYVSVYDVLPSGPKLLKKMCGIGLPLPIKSSSNEMLIKFHSDNLISNPGFKATFESIFHRCKSGEFKCDDGRCIHVRLLCNKFNDCLDNTDEAFCKCDRYKCENYRCVNHDAVCNGENDCGDWSDEKECGTQNALSTIKQTPPPAIKTTLRPVVLQRLTTQAWTCNYGQYSCQNKICIEAIQRCDGHNDCGDNSDESDCSGQCRTMNGGCQHVCDHTHSAGVKCSCYKGFKLDFDGITCIDINECSSRPCAELCENVYGSFKCGCSSGYRLAPNQINCTDFDECSSKPELCDQLCINTIGGYECACYKGYRMDKVENGCVDIDECANDNGGCSEKCVNTIGSFSCACNKQGYVMSPGKTICEEVDECELGTSLCQQKCINVDGSYQCDCYSGFRLSSDKHKCIDLDECLEGVPGCWGNCINTIGSYVCQCDTGFRGIINNTKCEDLNECLYDNGGCSNLCVNTYGSFECKCHQGFTKRDSRAFTCIDKDECLDNPCEEECVNTPGSFQCRCKTGYDLVNSTKCRDIDECKKGLDGCQYSCNNSPGSFFCTCPDGFILDSDMKQCITAVNGTGCHRLHVEVDKILLSEWTNVTSGWAWQAWININFGHFNIPRFRCMGVLVHKELILTTAHCVRFRSIDIEPEKLLVWLGSYNYGNRFNQTNVSVKKVIYHTKFDLALLQLSKQVIISPTIQPLCLFQGDHDVDVSLKKTVVTATWQPNSLANNSLWHIFGTVDEPHLCTWNGQRIFRNQDSICIRFGSKHTFLPMSGSPLVGMLRGTSSLRNKQRWYLTGVLVYGDCYPGVRKTYSRLYKYVGFMHANAFVEWIREEIKTIENN